ncbi:MAG: S1 family peptidase [Anaerolineae bacterium]|jgi:secreted trypsin-like serine protease
MKKVSILAILVLLLAAGALPAAAITGGELDDGRHPNVGLMIADIDGEPQWRCSGTLIAPRVFLTAGHCTGDGATAARVWFAGDIADVPDYPYGGEVAIEGTPIPHPDYGWGSQYNDAHDVGVVILDEAVTDIKPAQLAEADLLGQLKKAGLLDGGYKESTYFTSVGYGVTLVSWPPAVLDSNKVRMVSQSEYFALTKPWLHLMQRAVFDESGTCGGDSGGPAFWVEEDGTEILVAVTSWGDGGCAATGFDYRVDTPEILDWIYSQFP